MHEHLLTDQVPCKPKEDADRDQAEIDLRKCWKISYRQLLSL
jgi:hypothetical protein